MKAREVKRKPMTSLMYGPWLMTSHRPWRKVRSWDLFLMLSIVKQFGEENKDKTDENLHCKESQHKASMMRNYVLVSFRKAFSVCQAEEDKLIQTLKQRWDKVLSSCPPESSPNPKLQPSVHMPFWIFKRMNVGSISGFLNFVFINLE